ncbi:PREDICTED: DNA-directed RNA polymerase V subunit 5C [Tarenaya hassleriana]|uniref:DNA-directed RNA polymerase V subunit 5C n=1 Tax=Tarenaya hassleriana TaxID=28532 RepID=UPI00053C5530|nr:PREDICTED: DNA-directed RNA polymerase V subunit 5C [Tarenaya hassleriana]
MAASGGESQCIGRFVDESDVDTKRVYLARKTVLEMLHDRGYEVVDSELSCSLDEFRSSFGDKPNLERVRICVPLRDDPGRKMLVIFMGTEPITVKSIRAVRGQIAGSEGLHGLILVLQSKMNRFAQNELPTFPYKVETFMITDLLVNISKHVMQPKHEVLSEEEKARLLKKYGLEDKMLPRMLESDSFVKYYGLEKGQVVKFMYKAEPVGSFVTYRCIV